MRVPKVRFTVRRALVAIAVVAFALGGLSEWERHGRRVEAAINRDQAAIFDGMRRDFLARASAIEAGAEVARYPGEPADPSGRTAWSKGQAAGFARNARRLRRMASDPSFWERVASDPFVWNSL